MGKNERRNQRRMGKVSISNAMSVKYFIITKTSAWCEGQLQKSDPSPSHHSIIDLFGSNNIR
jgi:hypothetical protein